MLEGHPGNWSFSVYMALAFEVISWAYSKLKSFLVGLGTLLSLPEGLEEVPKEKEV